jgi:cytochrome c-type biogenesis protein
MEEVPVIVAFGAGLLSFLSPCVLPLIPVYFASMVGSSATATAGSHRVAIFFHSVSFVLGFTAVFTLLGAGAGLMGLAISEHIVLIRKIAGILMILMGGFLLLALKVPWLNFERRINAGSNQKTGYLRSFITGGVFALGWTPCVGPILGGILALAVGTGTAVKGAYLLIIYSLGLGLPFLIIGIAFDALRRQLTRIQRYSVIVYVVSGLLMIVVGVLVLTDKLALLSISV